MQSFVVEELDAGPISPKVTEHDDDLDETFVDVVTVSKICLGLLEEYGFTDGLPDDPDEIQSAAEEAASTPAAVNPLEDYFEALDDAYRCGEQLLERDDLEEVQRDLTVIDHETLIELRATIGYVAPHLGFNIEFPDPDCLEDGDSERA